MDKATLGNFPEAHCRSDQQLTAVPPGGGGYGDSRNRDPSLVAAEVKNGYISKGAAIRG